ncbi:hypothetical protein BDZ94DRAFT_1351083 [Collybia nuda]|uniref:Csf1 N-terminal domain-containing protein n=1 Tax=Collybia nuda TaxID=64659 RepID=A0A9P5Y9D1_9AGAR|nr:hypothetical protein BDZ94DRAFT_1351083 [Collybia nuda]
MFNRLLLISCICIVIALILYFFHWNRFIGFLIGRAIRVLYWNDEASSIWVEIGSIHFSLIGGRILLKDTHYHSSNQTIKVVKGQVQWRYWIRRPTSEEEIGTPRSPPRSSNCRIQISLQGFEWFLYNRTAAYDNIISQMEKNNLSRSASGATGPRQKSSRAASSSPFYPPSVPRGFLRMPYGVRATIAWIKRQLPNLDPKDLLPLGVEVIKGAIVCGNSSTPNLLVAEFRRTEGTFGVVKSRSKYDLHKQVLALKFQNVSVRFVRNADYVDPMTTMGELVQSRIAQYSTLDRASSYLGYRAFIKLWHQLRLSGITDKFASDRRGHHAMTYRENTPRSHKKPGNTADEITPIGADFSKLEYAIQRKILETPLLELSYYSDVVGEVPPHSEQMDHNGIESIDIGNGDTSPEWGIDLVISGGFLRYGPWADRQRWAELQKAFFPPTYQDGEVTPLLHPGDKRMWTALRVFIELHDSTTLQIPFREPSKDWQWDGQGDTQQRRRIREPAAIHLSVGDRSSISYTLPMITSPSGYQPVLEVHLDTVVVTSSLNDIRLVAAESCRVHCDLPSPLKWNCERTWIIAASLRQPVLYLVRDHINMFTDLGKDWTTGPLADYQRFIPMIYAFELQLHHFELNMYANDHNIIDKPLIRDENALLVTRGAHFSMKVEIPSTTYRPEWTTVPFTIEAPDISMGFSLPRWNTNALHAPTDGNSIAKLGLVRLKGSYQYFAEVRDDYVEQLKLDFTAQDVAFKEIGWSIRYFMVLRDNYLGSFTHFSTLYEYLEKKKRGLPIGDPLIVKYREGKSNVLQVEILLALERGTIVLPVGLPGYESRRFKDNGIGACIIAKFPELQLQFRLHDYYMEMSLNIDTVTSGIVSDYPELVTYASRPIEHMHEIIFVDGVDITANRLFGPQPRTATYVCIWEISIGRAKALLCASEARLFAAAGNAFRLNYVDFPNAPASEFLLPIDPDVTFIKFTLAATDITWRAGNSALVLSLPCGVKVDSNDLGGLYYHKITSLRIPEIHLKVMVIPNLKGNRWLEAVEIVADAFLDIYTSPLLYRDMAQVQLTYVEEQDLPTGRAQQMFNSLRPRNPDTSLHTHGLYLPHPSLPSQSYDAKPAVLPRTASTHEPAPLLRISGLAQLSESDGEEGISEAERDARLARTRTSTPVSRFVDDDDQNMISGDESDDEDLTDASSDGDWSNISHKDSSGADNSLFMHYSHVTRQYATRHLEVPNLWEGSPFILTRDRILLGLYHTDAANASDESGTHVPPASTGHVDLNLNTTRFRYKAKRVIEIRITPLILPAVSDFESDMENNPLGPELTIDAMIASHVGRISAVEGPQMCIVFEASVPSAVIYIFQRIVMSDGHPTISRELLETNKDSLDVMAIAQYAMGGIVTTGVISEQNISFSAGLDRLSLTLDMSLDKRTVQPAPPNEFVFSYTLEDVAIHITRDGLVLECGNNLAQIGHLGPEYVVATCIALTRNGEKLADIGRKWEQYSSRSTQIIVSDILRRSENLPIVDPLSTIQPSYLIQSGTPQRLRTDTTFRFLFHLRNCLWHLDGNDYNSPWPNQENETSLQNRDEFISLLESRLLALDQDANDITHWSSLKPFFSGLRGQEDTLMPKRRPYTAFSSLSVRFGGLSVVILDPSGCSHSELTITDIKLSGRTRSVETLQFSTHLTSISQTSLKDKRPQGLIKASASILLGEITWTVFPHLMKFVQLILRVRRHYHAILPHPVAPTPSNGDDDASAPVSSLDITFALRDLCIQAGAESLVFEFGITSTQGASSLLLKDRWNQSMNHSVLFRKVYVQARSPGNMEKQNDQGILASIDITNSKVNFAARSDASPKKNVNLMFSIGGFKFNVPRSALRLYRFIEEWRADFLPGMEATMQTLLSELQSVPLNPASPIAAHRLYRPIYQIQGHLSYFGISLQVMHGTWLSWEASDSTMHFNMSNVSNSNLVYNWGLQITSITLSISSKPNARDALPSPRVKLVLPPLSATGHYDGSCMYVLSLVNFIELKVKPSHWDTLLAVQQKFGQDFNDLVTLVQETNFRKNKSPPKKVVQPNNTFNYRGFFKIHGFRISLEGLSSVIFLECQDIGGGVNNIAGLAWDITLSDLALSLAPRAVIGPQYPGFNRNHRSAFVIIDFRVSADNRPFESSTNTVVEISVTKIHAVMQPSSIGEVGDFIDYLQAEMLNRREQRATELAAFKEKTQSILKTFEGGTRDTYIKAKASWLDTYAINVSTRNVGVAFPLTHDQDLELPQIGSRDSTAVRAFLFSIKLVEFGTHRGETGQATMKGLSFQFVPRFRQSVASDFSGETHQTRNRLVYPEMEAQLRSKRTGFSTRFWIGANVSGFILDLDSTIPAYVFSLIDVYRQGKERVDRVSANIPRTPSVEATPDKEISLERPYTTLPTSNVFASLTFLSGKVRVYSGSASKMYRTRSFSRTRHELSDEQVMDLGAEVFNLPVVSVWAEYRATPGSQKVGAAHESEPSILMFRSTVHSSQNTLRPTLLPFLTELVSHVETRLRRVSMQTHLTTISGSHIPTVSTPPEISQSVSSMRISFSLRIDQSKLELTCQPDVNVIAGLHWDSGGFMVNVSPGARKITLTGAVGGLTLGLKHGFLSEDCVKLDARNLSFSVTFAKVESKPGTSVSSVSVILDTEFLGVVRFSRLQDVLCFKAVWLDRIPIFNGQSAAISKTPSRASASATPTIQLPRHEFSTIILVRIRQIMLDVDLGQSISAVTLDLKGAVMRTKLTEILSELSIFVAELSINAKGNIAGHAHVPRCFFQTIRSTESAHPNDNGKSRMLELRMTSGPLVIALESDHQKLLHYRAEPLEVEIFDDWSRISSEIEAEERPLRLSFTIVSPEIIAVATVGTIPKLLTYANKFTANMDAQRQGASRESKTFRVTRTPKPENPLSAVAEAMLHSARSRFKEAESGLSYVIMQHMSLRLDLLRLAVFPRTMDDLEIAQFIGRDVRARLDRVVESELLPGKRDLKLSFSSMTTSKFTGLGHPQNTDLIDGREWLMSLLKNAPEAIIVGLPSMTMHMISEEEMNNLTTCLIYDFHSEFVRREGMRDFEDIYITLNVSLYSWLTILRKTLTREMDQVKASNEWRALLITNAMSGPAAKKKLPEPLKIGESSLPSPRSATSPQIGNTPSPPFSPTTALSRGDTLSPLPSLTLGSPSSGPQAFPSMETQAAKKLIKRSGIVYQPRTRHIERLTMRQLGEATPDVMHPFFMKKAGFNLEDSLPQYVHEYATAPLEEIMEVLLRLYSRQLLAGNTSRG